MTARPSTRPRPCAAPLLLLATCALPARAAGDPLADAAARLRAHAALAGRFTQSARSGLSGRVTREAGSCVIARDGRARFDYDAAAGRAGKVALSDGRRFTLYLPEDRQLVRQAVDPDAAPALLFADPARLRARFAVETAPRAGGGLTIRLSPRAAGAPWRSATLELAENGLPVRLALLDESGSETAWEFALKPAGAPAPSFFTFTPPEGTEIVGE